MTRRDRSATHSGNLTLADLLRPADQRLGPSLPPDVAPEVPGCVELNSRAVRAVPSSAVVRFGTFGPARQPTGLAQLSSMERELESLIGRPVDLRTYHDLSKFFRDEVAATAQVLYAA